MRTTQKLLSVALLTCVVALPARAHPDYIMYARVLFSFEGQAVTAIGESWAFDTVYSQELLAEFDANGDGRFDAVESAIVAEEVMATLAEVRHFTYVLVGDRDLGPLDPFAFQATATNGYVAFSFGMRLPEPVDPAQTAIQVEIMDPDLLVGVEYTEVDPVALSGAEGLNCSTSIKENPAHAYFGGTVIPEQITLTCRP